MHIAKQWKRPSARGLSKNALVDKLSSQLENIHTVTIYIQLPHTLKNMWEIYYFYILNIYTLLHDDEQNLAKLVTGNYGKKKLGV